MSAFSQWELPEATLAHGHTALWAVSGTLAQGLETLLAAIQPPPLLEIETPQHLQCLCQGCAPEHTWTCSVPHKDAACLILARWV